MHSMFDWASFRAPCFHPDLIDGGRVMKITPGGEIEWQVASRLAQVHQGEYSCHPPGATFTRLFRHYRPL